MNFHYNPNIWVYLGSALILLLATVYSVRYKRFSDRFWILSEMMIIFWCLGYALQISGTDLNTQAFWYLAANDFVGWMSPAFLFLWAMRITGRKKRLTKLHLASLLALPVITDILNLTNSSHGLVYRKMWLDTTGENPLLKFHFGPWYLIATAYCCILLLAVIVMLTESVLNRRVLHRKQSLTLTVIVVAILIFIILCIVTQGLSFYPYDLTPVAISISIVVYSLVFRFRKQEAIPVPRNAVIEKMSSAVLILDNHNRIMDMNSAAESFLGLKAAKVSGCSIEEALYEWTELVSAICDKTAGHCEFSRDGRNYNAYFSNLNDGRRSAGNVVVIQDVTDHKAVAAQVIQQKQALVVLQERERLARELHDSLGQILDYTNIQLQAVREMLKAGQLPEVDRNLVSLSQVITETNTEVREFIYGVKTTLLFKKGFFSALHQYLNHFEENFQIQIELQNRDNITDEEFTLPVWVQIFRIIQEALSNVRKHAHAGKVIITFQKTEQQVLVSVVDDGEGFDPDKNISGHSSFGMEVMRERAGQIGGELHVDSAKGRGTTVTITVPCSDGSSRESGQSDPGTETASTDTKIRVLLVDDHSLFLEGLRNLIEPRGFEVVGTARDGMEALEKARLLHPEMILMDLQMPRCNGLIATRLIKAEMPEIKIVILTMSDREHDLFEAIKNGASGYLLKGLSTEDFIEQLCGLASNSAIISHELASQVMQEFSLNDKEPLAAELGQIKPEEYLSQRQIEILSLIAKGYTYKEVASKLFISERTVKYEMSDILRLLHLQNRSQAVAYAQKAGLGKV